MQKSLRRIARTSTLIFVLCLTLIGCVSPEIPQQEPSQDWKTSTPEEQGMDPDKLAIMLAFLQEEDLNLHSLLIIRNGTIVSETYFQSYDQGTRHRIYSCTKSFISALVGIALDKGFIKDLHQPVLDFFPEADFKDQDAFKQGITIENLLTMTSGLAWTEQDPMDKSQDWVSFVLDKPIRVQPGSQFNYCSGCSHVLSAVLQQATSMKTQDFAEKYLFQPLGITNSYWETDPTGVPNGGWGLQLTPRDMAKLGYLFLQEGKWDGQEIIAPQWVQLSTQKHVDTDEQLGYGYHWWTLDQGHAYAALGLYGQTILVVPEADLVVVTTAGATNHDQILKLIQMYILPAVR